MKTVLRILGSIALCSAAFSVHAQDGYPNKAIALVVGYAPGGSVDLAARIIAPELSKRLGQQVIVDNRAGAGGTIGAKLVTDAAPDGYTLLLGSGSEVSIARMTNTALKYDGQRDLAPVGFIGTQPMVLVANPKQPFTNTAEFLDFARKNPGKLNFATSGNGTPLHLAGELIKEQGKLFMTHVPYRGGGPAITDIMSGQIELGVLVLSTVLPQIKTGNMRALGITEAKRAGSAPDIPALAELPALKGVDMGVWFGLLAPAKTPAPIVARLNRELNEVLKQPDVIKKYEESGFTLRPGTPEAFTKFIADETSKYARIVKAANIKE
jgi:tripartite-type tricarboxylate transporter receptor subunit TctC